MAREAKNERQLDIREEEERIFNIHSNEANKGTVCTPKSGPPNGPTCHHPHPSFHPRYHRNIPSHTLLARLWLERTPAEKQAAINHKPEREGNISELLNFKGKNKQS
ncbi:hypothetical protein ACP275_03G074800 [Erythranthe tilingii]